MSDGRVLSLLALGSVVYHLTREDSRRVHRALRLNHVLDDSADALGALDELCAEAFVGLTAVLVAEGAIAVGVGDAAHDAVANANEEERVKH